MRMRRLLFTAALLFLLAIPLRAQRRGGFAPRMGGAVAMRPSGRTPVAAPPRMVMRGGFGFVHRPGFGVFFGPRRFHHRHIFFRPSPFFNPFFSANPFFFGNSFPAYPYYPYGLQSDFVYSNAATQPADDYSGSQNAVLSNEVSRLQAEVDVLREQQAEQAQRQQYALKAPTETPRPLPSTRPRQEAPAPPTVLIYRDGRRVEVSDYAVVGQTLWIFSEERARKIALAALDLDATRQANKDRGVEFNVGPPPSPSPPESRPR
jgi:hypothetical protein